MITFDLRRIVCAKDLQDTAKEALKISEDALTPRLDDWGLLDDIYRHYKDFLSKMSSSHHSEKRKEFIFIVTYLYCPTVLIGGSMPRGFRGKLKELLHVESPSAISNYASDLLFLYSHYQDFRRFVEDAFDYISSSLPLVFSESPKNIA